MKDQLDILYLNIEELTELRKVFKQIPFRSHEKFDTISLAYSSKSRQD